MTAQLETAVTAVAVYPDRARVTRSGTVGLEPGPHRLEIADLPLSLSPESVRVSGQGTARARLGGVEVRRHFFTQTPSASAAELERRIEEIDDQEAVLSDEETLLKSTLAFLNGLAQQGESYGRGLAYGKFRLEEGADLLAFLTERTGAAQERMRQIAIEKRGLAQEKKKLERELAQIRSARPKERYAAIVDVEILTAGDLTLELAYVVGNASWTPLYDLRLTADDAPQAELGYLAQVTQRSGEDWAGVRLTLSTARPALSATLPELDPWTIRVYAPPPPMQAAPRPMMEKRKRGARFEAEEMVGAAMDQEPEPVEMETVQAAVSREGAAVTFTVAQPTDVPSDGSPHKTSVATLSLTPELDYLTAPKLVSAAYRRATLTNDTDFTLLPGPTNIFFGPEFVGTTQLEHVAPGESFEVFVGADDRIKVERELVAREVDKRLLGDKRRLRYAYQIRIENLRDRPEKVIARDQLPISGHENIQIRMDELSPRPKEQTDLGLLEWELTLEAGQSAELLFAFTVEHPRDLRIVGLPEN
jgi:uncharacterized protein (TIGR02231 family)